MDMSLGVLQYYERDTLNNLLFLDMLMLRSGKISAPLGTLI